MPDEAQQEPGARIRLQPIEQEMQRSYIDYAMSVIVGRALPDARDGLKPVQRRILYTMQEEGMTSGAQFKKSARVVGGCLARYHPHGDMAIYDALARMVQDFSLRYPLVQGQGNWGSTEDEPAAMRYTECRLSKIAEELLQDIEKGTVEWADNFDGTQKEPLVLPAKFPNLLVNGSSGIAVGMATNMPPHNLVEIVDGLLVLIDNPSATLPELYNPETGPIRGPDFPTGGVLHGVAGVTEAYSTGRGLISLRAKASFEEAKGDKVRIVITEIPYFVNKGTLVESIALLVKQKRIEGVTDLRDESDQDGMRIVLELKRDAVEDVVLNQLYHHTQMDSTFGIINLALVGGEPKVLGLRELLQSHVDYRIEVVRLRTQFDLNKARQREHIVEGLLTAIDHLDEVIRIIRRARDGEDASNQLRTRYLLSEDQAKAILDMSLRKLTGLETQALRTEQDELKKTITDLEGILASRPRVLDIIKTELRDLKEKYGDARRTEVRVQAAEIEVEDLIPEEDCLIAITSTGYIKRLPVRTYRQQRRGGKGRIGMQPKEEDFVVNSFVASTHDFILFFSSRGRCYWLKAYKVPAASPYSRGKPIVNLLSRLSTDERIQDMIPARRLEVDQTVILVTEQGYVKRMGLSAFKRPIIRGVVAIDLRPGDTVIEAKLSDGRQDIFMATKKGFCLRLPESWLRVASRTTRGAKAIKFIEEGDRVIGMHIGKEPGYLLTVTEKGLGKLTDFAEYRYPPKFHAVTGCRPIRTVETTDRTGQVVGIRAAIGTEELVLSTRQGIVIRTSLAEVRKTGRIAQGVRLIDLEDDDLVVSATLVPQADSTTEIGRDVSTPEEHDGT